MLFYEFGTFVIHYTPIVSNPEAPLKWNCGVCVTNKTWCLCWHNNVARCVNTIYACLIRILLNVCTHICTHICTHDSDHRSEPHGTTVAAVSLCHFMCVHLKQGPFNNVLILWIGWFEISVNFKRMIGNPLWRFLLYSFNYSLIIICSVNLYRYIDYCIILMCFLMYRRSCGTF